MPADDNALMERVKQGDALAFECLMKRYRRGVLKFLVLFVANEETAADLTQETFLRVFYKANRYRANGSFKTWLFTIARNLAISHFRRLAVRRIFQSSPDADKPFDLDQVPAKPKKWSPESRVLNRELSGEIRRCVDRLTPILKEAFLLCDVMGLNLKEIADVTGTSASTIKVRIFRARSFLRDALAGYVGRASGASQAPDDDVRRRTSRPGAGPFEAGLGEENGG